MEATSSFAPLAARLAARAAEIRPVDGAEVNWANFMALFVCAILEMLIALCEALDARAAADARLVAAPATSDGTARPVVVARAGRVAMPVAGHAPRLALVPDVQDLSPQRDLVLPGTAKPAHGGGPWPTWSRHPGPAWGVAGPPMAVPRRKTAFRLETRHAYFVAIL